jgi:hypothetical protein
MGVMKSLKDMNPYQLFDAHVCKNGTESGAKNDLSSTGIEPVTF